MHIKQILIVFFLCFSTSLFAQKLTPSEKAVFDEVAYYRKRVGEYKLINKWTTPIRYKIYGDTSSYLVKEVDSTFSQLQKLTGLSIKKTNDEDEVNFVLVFGKDPNDFSQYMPGKKPMESPATYRIKGNKAYEIYWAQCMINTKKFNARTDVKYHLKRQMLKVLGFLDPSKEASNSLFYMGRNAKIKIDTFDSNIIAAFYNPLIKPGMNQDQVDVILASK